MTTITVITGADSGPGSLREALNNASAGDIINFAPSVTEIDLGSTLTISKNVTIEGSQPGSIGTPGVTIKGGGPSSNFSDFTINAGVTATFDGLIIADGHATGGTGGYGVQGGGVQGGPGGGAAGGIYDAGALTLSNSQLLRDTATGGVGGLGLGGGAGGAAAGGIYVASTATLNLQSDSAAADAATGGQGGSGSGAGAGGAGGPGAVSGQSTTGSPGQPGGSNFGFLGGAGGGPGQPGQPGHGPHGAEGGGGGGGGGSAFADVGGAGTITGTITDTPLTVTNSSDSATVFGSLRYELSIAQSGDIINFAPSVTEIDLGSTLTISKNVTIEGSQPGSIGTPGVTIKGGGPSSNFSDFTINAGVTATFDGLIIADGHATGGTGGYGVQGGGVQGGPGGGAAGGIYDAGALTLSNSQLLRDTATGGVGGLGLGGGAGGAAAGGIYVASTATLNLQSDSAAADAATGGQGGSGSGAGAGGAGGPGAVSGQSTTGSPGQPGGSNFGFLGGAGGGPGQPGQPGHGPHGAEGGGGGGGGGSAFADVGGAGTITGTITDTACYRRGTLILTDRGELPVEVLAIGDRVMTASGVARPIKWIGRRSYGGRFVIGRTDILPICIKAGALDDNVPWRDLWISPHHAMFIDDVLIEARDLLNGVSIVQARSVDKVEYFHVELKTHDVIVAEGALSETFIDDDSRGMFHNAHEYQSLYPDVAALAPQYCAPRLDDGYEVEAARQRIALRAGLTDADARTAGALRGSVNLISSNRITGWAQNVDHPEAPVCLDIYAGGRLIERTLANCYREDLARARLGSGHHGFAFTPPPGLDFPTDTVEVRRSLDGAALEFSTDPVRALQPLPFSTTKRYPNVTVHRRTAGG